MNISFCYQFDKQTNMASKFFRIDRPLQRNERIENILNDNSDICKSVRLNSFDIFNSYFYRIKNNNLHSTAIGHKTVLTSKFAYSIDFEDNPFESKSLRKRSFDEAFRNEQKNEKAKNHNSKRIKKQTRFFGKQMKKIPLIKVEVKSRNEITVISKSKKN